MKKLTEILFMIFLIFLFSCSSKNNPTEPANQKAEPQEPTIKTVNLPDGMAQSDDVHAQMAVGWASLANAFTAYNDMFVPPNNAKILPKVVDEGEYTWNVGSLAITLIYSNDDQGSTWKIIYNGTDTGGITYLNWVAIEAEQSADENSGTMLVYQENSTDLASKWEWSNSSDGGSDVTFIDYSEPNLKLNIHSNADGSGEMNYYEKEGGQFVLKYKITWNSDGSGAWWDYEANENGTWQ